jgi:hypothetical protein
MSGKLERLVVQAGAFGGGEPLAFVAGIGAGLQSFHGRRVPAESSID